MKRHLSRALDITPFSKNPERVVIYAGHSSILQLALVGLGVYRHICANPPFGSRVSFEVWEKHTDSDKRTLRMDEKESVSRKNMGAVGQDFQTAQRRLGEETMISTFVRVLYNGEDVTHLIPSCVMRAEPDNINLEKDYRRRLSKNDNAAKGNHLCPIDRLFLNFDSGTKLQYNYLPEDCHAVFRKIYTHYYVEFVNDL